MRYLWSVLLLVISPLASAEWQLEGDVSRISFVSVTRGKIAEVQRFKGLTGQIDDQGGVRLVVPLAQVDSGLAMRDEHLRNEFFQIERFPEATISSQIDLSRFAELKPGQSQQEKVDFDLDLHGESRRLKAEVLITRSGEERIQVTMLEPLVLKLIDFDLEERLGPLQALSKVPTIVPEVPVYAQLSFRQVVTQNP
ncbi:MAG: hypothetical protein GAK43_01956 [Stenotrophomonas maltophilia]|nr:MAG: hypothetical protein GAK43_01956 [Stenotrophomonas maltophilia]